MSLLSSVFCMGALGSRAEMAPAPLTLGQWGVDGSPGKAAALFSLLDVPFLTCFPPVPAGRAGGGGGQCGHWLGPREVVERRGLLEGPLCCGWSRQGVSTLLGTWCRVCLCGDLSLRPQRKARRGGSASRGTVPLGKGAPSGGVAAGQ